MKYRNQSGRQLLARFCNKLSLSRLVLNRSSIRIVVYHRILGDFDPLRFPFNSELVDATVAEFEREIVYLKENFNIVTFEDVISHLDAGISLPDRPLLITFDDGYQDNYHHAFPLLREHNVPATFFLATSYVGGDATFWYDWLAFILLNTDRDSVSFGIKKQEYRLKDSLEDRMIVFRTVMNHLAGVDNTERLEVLDELNRNYGYVYDRQGEEVKALSRPLNWRQVSEMSRAGMEIGSHTMTHPFLSRVARQTLSDELSRSKRKIEEETGKPARVVAYPNGQRQDFNAEVKQMAREAGYALGLSYLDGINPLMNPDRFAMKRLHISPRHDFSMFRMALSWPGLF